MLIEVGDLITISYRSVTNPNGDVLNSVCYNIISITDEFIYFLMFKTPENMLKFYHMRVCDFIGLCYVLLQGVDKISLHKL